ncbi:putative bifunctional diguanylate cyclase/phosphodiesterase [Halomonas campaniensis]|uniref:Histidine kinase n=1 Tax=Halomonas campaniensis TaxID=213554 RepID=A0A246S5I4_9GAMM|nr:EAL domain-containing protein [Halomonas campaniensis]OWV31153.1 histidine kinase [Halomonas campaniensis]
MSSSNNQKMEKLLSTYKEHLLLYKTELEADWQAAQHDTKRVQHIMSMAHKLSGSGKAYGFVELSQLARELDHACDMAKNMPPKELISSLTRPIDDLLSALERDSASNGERHIPSSDSANALFENDTSEAIDILLVDDDPDFSTNLSEILSQYGYRVHWQDDISQLDQAITDHQPWALIVDMDFSGERFAGASQVSTWHQKNGTPLPVFFVSGYDSFDLRLASVRAGGTHFLRKPLDIPKLVSLLFSELNLAPSEPYRVMLVDDDHDLLSLYAEFLTKAGYNVTSATSAQEALRLLEQSHPELILVDVYMPGCSGIELGKIIRQHEEFATIPLIFMSAAADTDLQLACARLANDEFINKPIELWRLLMIVKSRVTKGRYFRSHIGALTIAETQITQDSLTALPMLANIRRDIEDALQKRAPDNIMAVVKFDIRDFHTINNLHGHHFGDEILQRLAWELTQTISPSDTLYRESSDEFLLLTKEHASQASLKKYVTGLTKSIEEIKITLKHALIALSADTGVAFATQDISKASELLDNADMAIFKAKKSPTTDICYFDASLKTMQQNRFLLENSIKEGLSSDQFIAVYQPIYTVNENKLIGFEALARWQHPEKGLLGPGEFIHLMEQRGLIPLLTQKMLTQTLSKFACWQRKHPHLFLSLNLSAQDIQEPIFLDHLESLLAHHCLNPNNIVLEITESELLFDWQQARNLLRQLKDLGVRLAIDDFGTGYSSLSYLQRIDADKLKIDRSFIHQWSQTGDARLLQTMVQLGKTMNMRVIAEGVEKTEELEFLQQLDCDQYQGFLAAKPMLAEEIERTQCI